MHRLCITLLILGALGTPYFGWAYHRASAHAMYYDSAWPRPHPWPDAWLIELHDWYDTRYPAPPGTFKWHGELGRLRKTVFAALCGSILMLAGGAIPLAWRYTRIRPGGGCRACGYDLRGSAGRAACPECGAIIAGATDRHR